MFINDVLASGANTSFLAGPNGIAGAKAKQDTSNELALDSGRIPFGPQSASGNQVQIHVRNLAYAFKT